MFLFCISVCHMLSASLVSRPSSIHAVTPAVSCQFIHTPWNVKDMSSPFRHYIDYIVGKIKNSSCNRQHQTILFKLTWYFKISCSMTSIHWGIVGRKRHLGQTADIHINKILVLQTRVPRFISLVSFVRVCIAPKRIGFEPTAIEFAHYGLKSSIVFKRTTKGYWGV